MWDLILNVSIENTKRCRLVKLQALSHFSLVGNVNNFMLKIYFVDCVREKKGSGFVF